MLVIADRNIDLATMLVHPWTYQALIHEFLDLHLNRVRVRDPTTGHEQAFDLDTRYQKFWCAHRGKPFPTVAAEVKNEVTTYQAANEELGRLSANGGAAVDLGALSEAELSEKGLNQFIGKLPELREQKQTIDMHTTIGTCIMEKVKVSSFCPCSPSFSFSLLSSFFSFKAHSLDVFFGLEENVMTKSIWVFI